MNYTVQELALQYAEAMTRFYQADRRYKTAAECDKTAAAANLGLCRAEMQEAQWRLAEATKEQAEMLNAE